MRRCSKCVMPDTRPNTPFVGGVCQACINHGKPVDWVQRYQQLIDLCASYRGKGEYDCIAAVSGGKDSYFIVHVLKSEMDMNPLLVTVADPFTKTEAGKHNLSNLAKVFRCDHITFTFSPDHIKSVIRHDFENYGEPLRFLEKEIYAKPTQLGIPLVFFGESAAYYFGTTTKESPTSGNGARFLGYYVPWSSATNLEVAEGYGFRDLGDEWIREGYSDNFEQIDSFGYLVHIWLKYPKFGFQRVSDIESKRIRDGLQTRKEAMKLVKERDHKLDPRALDDFCSVLGYTHKEFWEITERWNKYGVG